MKCNNVKKKITAYLDGELNPIEKKESMLHIDDCMSCRKELEDMEFVTSMIKPLAPARPSPYFYIKIKHAIENKLSNNYLDYLPLKKLRTFGIAFSLLVMSLFGSILGKFVIPESNGYQVRIQEIKNALNLAVFDDISEDSFGMIYNDLLKEKK